MSKIIDLRPSKVSQDFTRKSDLHWIAAWAMAVVFLATGLLYFHWLDAGCPVQGVMTWQGKECVQ